MAATNRAPDPRNVVVRALLARCGNRCAFEGGCDHRVVNDRGDFIAEVVHICAAAPGGERYDSTMTDEDRRSYSNLLILCHRHHVETDRVARFPVERMRAMKAAHEARVAGLTPIVVTPELIAAVLAAWAGAFTVGAVTQASAGSRLAGWIRTAYDRTSNSRTSWWQSSWLKAAAVGAVVGLACFTVRCDPVRTSRGDVNQALRPPVLQPSRARAAYGEFPSDEEQGSRGDTVDAERSQSQLIIEDSEEYGVFIEGTPNPPDMGPWRPSIGSLFEFDCADPDLSEHVELRACGERLASKGQRLSGTWGDPLSISATVEEVSRPPLGEAWDPPPGLRPSGSEPSQIEVDPRRPCYQRATTPYNVVIRVQNPSSNGSLIGTWGFHAAVGVVDGVLRDESQFGSFIGPGQTRIEHWRVHVCDEPRELVVADFEVTFRSW
jgi:hypothetical protein